MAKSPKLKGVWERITAPQAVSERRLRKFHFPAFSILRLAQDVKVQGFDYRSLVQPVENFKNSKSTCISSASLPACHKTWHQRWEDRPSFFSQQRILMRYHITIVSFKVYPLCHSESFHLSMLHFLFDWLTKR